MLFLCTLCLPFSTLFSFFRPSGGYRPSSYSKKTRKATRLYIYFCIPSLASVKLFEYTLFQLRFVNTHTLPPFVSEYQKFMSIYATTDNSPYSGKEWHRFLFLFSEKHLRLEGFFLMQTAQYENKQCTDLIPFCTASVWQTPSPFVQRANKMQHLSTSFTISNQNPY